VRNP
jgi:hypothetical protein